MLFLIEQLVGFLQALRFIFQRGFVPFGARELVAQTRHLKSPVYVSRKPPRSIIARQHLTAEITNGQQGHHHALVSNSYFEVRSCLFSWSSSSFFRQVASCLSLSLRSMSPHSLWMKNGSQMQCLGLVVVELRRTSKLRLFWALKTYLSRFSLRSAFSLAFSS